jgi:hypothetical protein
LGLDPTGFPFTYFLYGGNPENHKLVPSFIASKAPDLATTSPIKIVVEGLVARYEHVYWDVAGGAAERPG